MQDQYLTIALVLVALITGTVLIVNWASNRHIPGLLKIAIGLMITSFGILLLGTQGYVTPFVSIMLANALIMGGHIPVVMGLAGFWNQERSRLPLYCAAWLVVSMVGFYYFTFVDESMTGRIRIYTAMMVILYLAKIYVLANGLKIERKLRPVMAVTTSFGAFILLIIASFNVVTEFIFMLVRTTDVIPVTDQNYSMLMLSSIVTMTIFAFGVIIMTMEELSVEYQENAIYDPITTILNHRTFLEVSNRVLGVALRYTKPVSLLTIEVTNLDTIVDEFGVRVGNELLRHFSLMTTDRRRNEDILARSSYKEFRMLLPGVDEEGCKVVIEKIKVSLQGEEYVYRGKSLRAEIVISAITKREEELQLQQMFQEGEVDLFRIKQAMNSSK
ncbi:MAG: hypothetical protein COA96_08635 [SAR86 cluster bacterium]|uniref:GGDEF domain-containing protein n=1 Tax=SAR86 cluster bacterium TaxID=2030880 RepID=A0A2A5B031_9GAMM|nr:MAG: hypothetical protein COA96_08635 [SAR86 cluster bacterium]